MRDYEEYVTLKNFSHMIKNFLEEIIDYGNGENLSYGENRSGEDFFHIKNKNILFKIIFDKNKYILGYYFMFLPGKEKNKYIVLEEYIYDTLSKVFPKICFQRTLHSALHKEDLFFRSRTQLLNNINFSKEDFEIFKASKKFGL